jgi:hypothetical protein
MSRTPCSRRVGLALVLQQRSQALFRVVCKGEQREILSSDHALFDEPIEIDWRWSSTAERGLAERPRDWPNERRRN